MHHSKWTDKFTESISWKGWGWEGMDRMEGAIPNAVRSWYSEIKNGYNYHRPRYWRHWTFSSGSVGRRDQVGLWTLHQAKRWYLRHCTLCSALSHEHGKIPSTRKSNNLKLVKHQFDQPLSPSRSRNDFLKL